MSNIVDIAASLDGYIADKNGDIEWLQSVSNPNSLDFGWAEFIDGIDAIIMGRTTAETVLGFGLGWPYTKPVFILSRTWEKVPGELVRKAELINGPLKQVIKTLNKKGINNIYVDGGKTINSFMREGLVDELIITTIPVILGGGIPLFGELDDIINLEHIKTNVFLDAIVQNHYKVKN